MSVAIAFPAELTLWSHVSAHLKFLLQGANVSSGALEVCNYSLSLGSRMQNVILQSPNAQSPTLHCAGVVSDNGTSLLSINMHSLDLAEDPTDLFLVDGDELEIQVANFILAYLPDPVFPHVGGAHSPREPLPSMAHHPQAYYMVIKGYKISIFLEKWYFDLQYIHFALLMMDRTDMEGWAMNGSGYV